MRSVQLSVHPLPTSPEAPTELGGRAGSEAWGGPQTEHPQGHVAWGGVVVGECSCWAVG